MNPPRIAVLVPCYNEEAAIAKVVADFRAALPEAAIYVYDNNSRDLTALKARAAGAIVIREPYVLGEGDQQGTIATFADPDDNYFQLMTGMGPDPS